MEADASIAPQPRPSIRRDRTPSVAVVYFATVATPSLLIYFSLATSQTLGFMLATALMLALSGWRYRYPAGTGRLILVVLSVVLLHLTIAAAFQRVDAGRAMASLIPMTLLLVGASFLAEVLPRISARRLQKGLVRCFLLMCVLALFAILDVQPPSAEEWRKPVFPFFEPAAFALPFIPLLMFVCITASGKSRVAFLLSGFACTALIQNLTLATGFLLAASISFSWRMLSVAPAALIMGGGQLDLSYYADRLDFSGGGENLSNLVYVQGWQMIHESWQRSHGFGLGFQQLGVQGTDVPAAQIIRGLREGEDLNVLDGGFVFAKLAGEFGILGCMLGLTLLWLSFRSFRALRGMKRSARVFPAVALAHCSVLGYAVELFVRGASYFTGTTMLLIASLWLLNRRHALPRLTSRNARPAPVAYRPSPRFGGA